MKPPPNDAVPNDPRAMLRLPQVLALYPVSKSTWWQGIRDKKYPPGIKLSPGVTAWRAADIFALIEQATARTQKRNERESAEHDR